jgi:Predicted nucleotide-utilizing enzyme related to molybdopterin-biosynthesis enzyme MoeA
VVLIGDDPPAIKEALLRAIGQSDFVVVSGGLGVTDDDITARTAAEVLGLPIEESQRMVKNIRKFFEIRGRKMPDEALRMAALPQGADILCPDCAGFSLKVGRGVPVYFLPGIPAEARRIIDERVVPELVARLGGGLAVASCELTVFGLGESEIKARAERPGTPPGPYRLLPGNFPRKSFCSPSGRPTRNRPGPLRTIWPARPAGGWATMWSPAGVGPWKRWWGRCFWSVASPWPWPNPAPAGS